MALHSVAGVSRYEVKLEGLEGKNKTSKGSDFGLRARRSRASFIRPTTAAPLSWMVAVTVDRVLLTFVPASGGLLLTKKILHSRSFFRARDR